MQSLKYVNRRRPANVVHTVYIVCRRMYVAIITILVFWDSVKRHLKWRLRLVQLKNVL